MSGINIRVRISSSDLSVPLGTHADPARLAADINARGGFDAPEIAPAEIGGLRWVFDPESEEAYCEFILTDPDPE